MTRAAGRITALVLLMACLGACGQTAPQDAAIVEPATAVPASVTSPASASATSAADAGLAIAVARETADRAVREQTLHVQKQLREQQRQLRQAREAVERGDGGERCLAGQKMRRVANGWVQAGPC
jgi:hypothetical protein